MENTQCDKLAGRFTKMVADEGLVDVKFFLRNLEEAVTEQVCGEVEALYEAFEQNKFVPLDFKDSHRA